MWSICRWRCRFHSCVVCRWISCACRMIFFPVPFLLFFILSIIVYAFHILNDCWFRWFQSVSPFVWNDVWFLCNRVWTRTHAKTKSIMIFGGHNAYHTRFRPSINQISNFTLLYDLSVCFKLFWYTKITSFCVTTKWFELLALYFKSDRITQSDQC